MSLTGLSATAADAGPLLGLKERDEQRTDNKMEIERGERGGIRSGRSWLDGGYRPMRLASHLDFRFI